MFLKPKAQAWAEGLAPGRLVPETMTFSFPGVLVDEIRKAVGDSLFGAAGEQWLRKMYQVLSVKVAGQSGIRGAALQRATLTIINVR